MTIRLVVQEKGRAYHVDREVAVDDGYALTECQLVPFVAAAFVAEDIAHAEAELDLPICERCKKRLRDRTAG